jgi:transposase
VGTRLSRWLLRAREKGGSAVGLTKRGKGTKWMLVTDATGLPLGFLLESAQKAEVRLSEATLRTIRVPRERGGPRSRPVQLVADRAYDSRAFRHYLRRRGITPCIPERRRPDAYRPRRGRPLKDRTREYRHRWIVARTFAWRGNFRRLLIRWEHHVQIYEGFFTFALVLLCLRRLPKCPCA